jgi:transcriptional regulator with XRE-family HTH domain
MFAQRLRELRKSKNLLQDDLALYLNVTNKTISSYETESSEPNLEALVKIAEYFDVTVDYLLGVDIYKNKDDKELAKSLSGGQLDELPYSAQKDAAQIYKELLECIIDHQKYYDSVFINEYKNEPPIISVLLREIFDTIEAYKMITVYLKQNKSYFDTTYKFQEMVRKSDYLIGAMSNLAYYYKISSEPNK